MRKGRWIKRNLTDWRTWQLLQVFLRPSKQKKRCEITITDQNSCSIFHSLSFHLTMSFTHEEQHWLSSSIQAVKIPSLAYKYPFLSLWVKEDTHSFNPKTNSIWAGDRNKPKKAYLLILFMTSELTHDIMSNLWYMRCLESWMSFDISHQTSIQLFHQVVFDKQLLQNNFHDHAESLLTVGWLFIYVRKERGRGCPLSSSTSWPLSSRVQRLTRWHQVYLLQLSMTQDPSAVTNLLQLMRYVYKLLNILSVIWSCFRLTTFI